MLAKSILYCFFSAQSDICNQFLLGTVDNQMALGIIDKSLAHNFYYTLIYLVFVFNLVTMILRLNCYLLTSLSPDLNVLILWQDWNKALKLFSFQLSSVVSQQTENYLVLDWLGTCYFYQTLVCLVSLCNTVMTYLGLDGCLPSNGCPGLTAYISV